MKLMQAVAAYFAYKQSMGMRFATETRTLKSFCRTLGDVDTDQIEPESVRAFLDGEGPRTAFCVPVCLRGPPPRSTTTLSW